MTRNFYYLLCLSLLLCSCDNRNNLIVIQNVNLFDGENYHTNVNLILDSNVVSDITSEENWPKNSTLINGKGKTVIPPLLNAHVHIWYENHLKEALRAGVFGVFDMHATDKSANDLRKYRNLAKHAFYYGSGPGATVPYGHGTQFGIKVPTIDSSLSPQRFVKDRVDNHADYIKILREPSMPTISFTQTQEVIDAAHEHSKLCVAHVSVLSDALKLNTQHIDGFVHIWIDKTINKTQLDSLAGSKVFIVPTLYVIKKLLEHNQSKKWYKTVITYEELLQEIKKVYKSGIPILAGTDAPNFGLNYGDDLFIELKLLHQAGIPGIDVLRAATSNIYKLFRLKEFGKLEKGSVADFILINGDPIRQFDDIDKIGGIWRNGKQIK